MAVHVTVVIPNVNFVGASLVTTGDGHCELGRCVPPVSLTFDTGHRDPIDPFVTLVQRDNAFAHGEDGTRVVSFNGKLFEERVTSNMPLDWSFQNFDLWITTKGDESTGARATAKNLPGMPLFTGNLGPDTSFNFLGRGFQFGYGQSVVEVFHAEINGRFDPPLPNRVALDPLTILVPVQIVKTLPPPDSPVFGDLYQRGQAQLLV